ncbi:MAG: HAMP domain-containing sensor histidine kinase [Planctomycetota bacterium]
MRRTHLAIFGSVLAAAAGLAFLAARSLGAQRVMIEQASAENARRAAVVAAGEWRVRLDEVTVPFLNTIPKSGSSLQLAIELSALEERPEAAAAFALDRNGRMTWPPPPAAARAFIEVLPGDQAARDALARGFRAEFTSKDGHQALREYAEAGAAGFGQTVRVEAKLQEAALAAKVELPARAISAYTEALAMGRFTEPERVVSSWLERARLRLAADPDGAETDVLQLAESVFGDDSGRYGTALPAARTKVAAALASWPFTAPGRQRWGTLEVRAAREKAAAETRERAAGLVAALVRQRNPPAYAALDGGFLAAWQMRPGGACAGVVLRAAKLSLPNHSGALMASDGAWTLGVEPGGASAAIPGAEGLAVALPPSNEGSASVQRQRLLYIAGLAVLMAALAAGLWMSFRAVRREAALARLKSDFVSQVSHELKTPLALVRMYAETLDAGKITDDAQKKEYMQVILRESERLSAMIEKILDFAKLERGEKTFDRRSGDLVAAAQEAAGAFAKQAGVAVKVEAGRPVRAEFDKDGLGLALRNLLENAVKYSEGAPDITVKVAERNGTALVMVEDRGIGVPADDRERVFERFYRAADSRATKVKGTGLGLALVARVMEGHGGAARCEPRQGGGSRFVLEFPRRTDATNHPGR